MDRADFEQTYLASLPALYRMACSILHQEADVQDALQEAALRAWSHVSAIRQDTAAAYLMRIVINECRNIQRKRRRLVPTEAMPESAAPQPTSDLADAMAQLPEKLRLPLLLKYMEGYSEQETARILGITVAAVKSRLRRARQAMQQLMKEVDFE